MIQNFYYSNKVVDNIPFVGSYRNKPLEGMAPTECPLSACLLACLLAGLLALELVYEEIKIIT